MYLFWIYISHTWKPTVAHGLWTVHQHAQMFRSGHQTDSTWSFLISPFSAAALSAPHHLSFIWINATGSYGLYFLYLSLNICHRSFRILSSGVNTLWKILSGNKTAICRSASDACNHTCTSHNSSHVQLWQHLVSFLQFTSQLLLTRTWASK